MTNKHSNRGTQIEKNDLVSTRIASLQEDLSRARPQTSSLRSVCLLDLLHEKASALQTRDKFISMQFHLYIQGPVFRCTRSRSAREPGHRSQTCG